MATKAITSSLNAHLTLLVTGNFLLITSTISKSTSGFITILICGLSDSNSVKKTRKSAKEFISINKKKNRKSR